jgi:branched-chain amino acid transport system substrate-binding protein
VNDNLRRWLPWIAVAAVAVIVVVIIAINSGGDDTAAETTTTAGTETTTTTVAEETTTTVAEETTTTEAMAEFAPVPLKLGSILPETGGLAVIVDALENPIRMGVDEINAVEAGLVSVDFADSGTDPNVASANVDQFLGGGYNGILGAAASGVSAAIYDKVAGSNMVMCSGSNTGALFSSSDYDPWYFRTAPSDTLQGPLLARVALEDSFQTFAIAYQNTEYGAGLANSVKDGFEQNGAEVLGFIAYDPNATSFTDVADEVAASGAESLVIISYSEGGQIILDLAGKFDGQIYVTDGFKDSVGADQLGGNPGLLEGIRGTAPSASPENGTPGFGAKLEAAYPGTPTIFSAQFYDCLMVEVLAAQAAQSADPAVYVDYMIPVTRDGEVCTSFDQCYALLAEGKDIDYNGASGPLDFLDNGEPGIGTYDIYTYDASGAPVTDSQVVAP